MRKYLVLIVGISAIACQAFAQRVDLSLKLAYSTFVAGEPVLVQATLVNQTRNPITFDEGVSDSLLIEVSKDNQYNTLTRWNDDPFMKPLVLAPGNTLEHKLEVDKWFSFEESGKYLIRVVVIHNDMRYESAPRSFDIVPGMNLKSGVQMFVDKTMQRNFKLVYWSRTQTNHLFLRIDDEPSGQVWDTIDLGTFTREDDPKLNISPSGEVTILHRATRDGFLRTVIWSLPNSVEIAERDPLLDPEISASQRVRHLYGDMQETTEKKRRSSWWKFW